MSSRSSPSTGFTLIEMIAVMAIMALLATAVLPTVLRTIDQKAVEAERANLRGIGQGIAAFVRTNRALPTENLTVAPPIFWYNRLLSPVAFTEFSLTQLQRNSRFVDRRYLVDPAPGGFRVLLISGMRNGLTLPATNTINTLVQFDLIWSTQDGSVPGGGTGLWANWANYGSALVVERWNFTRELTPYVLTLNNLNTATAAYRLMAPTDPSNKTQTTVPSGTNLLLNSYPGDVLELYVNGGVTPTYRYSVSDRGKSFQCKDNAWTLE